MSELNAAVIAGAASHALGTFFRDLDILVGDLLPRGSYSDFDERGPETVSSKMGKAQYRLVQLEWDGKDMNYYPYIPLHHPLGQLFASVCEGFEGCHSMRHICTEVGVDIEAMYPGVLKAGDAFLRAHGYEPKKHILV